MLLSQQLVGCLPPPRLPAISGVAPLRWRLLLLWMSPPRRMLPSLPSLPPSLVRLLPLLLLPARLTPLPLVRLPSPPSPFAAVSPLPLVRLPPSASRALCSCTPHYIKS